MKVVGNKVKDEQEAEQASKQMKKSCTRQTNLK